MVGDYIGQQQEITEAMRAILVDWLVEVQEKGGIPAPWGGPGQYTSHWCR